MQEVRKTPKEIGKAISAYLKENGITHEDAAERLGYSKQVVSNITGGTRIGPRTAARWVKAFGFDFAFLVTGVGNLFPSEANTGTVGPETDRYDELLAVIRSQQETIERLTELLSAAKKK